MILFANGDSNTEGQNLKRGDNVFAELVASHFNLPLTNIGLSGCSNSRIIRTSQAIDSSMFVLIGWTSWEREEWLFNNEYYQINNYGSDSLPIELHDRHRNWFKNKDLDPLNAKSLQWHEKIWEYHIQLNELNVKHLFFNCFTEFAEHNTPMLPQEECIFLNEKDWQGSFIEPYNTNMTYCTYLADHGFKCDEGLHFEAPGHTEWANVLINHIKEHNLI